jgi:hypothetical protein
VDAEAAVTPVVQAARLLEEERRRAACTTGSERIPWSGAEANTVLDVVEFVRARVTEQSRTAQRDKVGVADAAERHGLALLLNCWGASWALGEDGRVWRIEWGNDFTDPCTVSVETDWRSRNGALFQASLRHPELRGLLPPRPVDARTCPRCHGRGVTREGEEFQRLTGSDPPLCFCLGLGWLPHGTRIPGRDPP